ncbi:2-dehydro-3-deoxy-D-gluconate 5-dehydrogenase [Gammaproteobacteria bacterium]|nr:2-dehydro-3-deoxy-D-gluconate 5-dehydrogenase [Gammaproteobacteria bacterium]
MSIFDLTGKIAIVTGGNRGLGKAIALELARAGAHIAIISTQKNIEIEQEIAAIGVKCESFAFNLADFDQYHACIARIVERFGAIDILVNNAGIQRRHQSIAFPKKDWDEVLDINASAIFFMCQEVGKIMINQGSGKIINLASLLSFQGGMTVPAYAASKAAVMGFSKSLANEWASLGVNVNCIAPGYMKTDMNTALLDNPTRNAQIMDRIPAGRWGNPEDIAGAAVFLASNAARYIHGHTLVVDGGWLGR